MERDDLPAGGAVSASHLSAEMRLLHHIVARILLPKTGRFDFITERELLLMVSLIQGSPVSLPALLILQMTEASTARRLCLPYGMALTRLFRAYGVSFAGEPYREMGHTDTYDEGSLHRMGYQRTQQGHWRCRVSGQPPVADSEEEEEEHLLGGDAGASGQPESPRRQPEPVPSTSDHSRDELRADILSLREEVQTLRDEMREGFAELRAAILSLRSFQPSAPSPPAPAPTFQPEHLDDTFMAEPAGETAAQDGSDMAVGGDDVRDFSVPTGETVSTPVIPSASDAEPPSTPVIATPESSSDVDVSDHSSTIPTVPLDEVTLQTPQIPDITPILTSASLSRALGLYTPGFHLLPASERPRFDPTPSVPVFAPDPLSTRGRGRGRCRARVRVSSSSASTRSAGQRHMYPRPRASRVTGPILIDIGSSSDEEHSQ